MIDEDLLRAVKVRAARLGQRDSQVIEDAVRRALGFDVLERLWARNDLPEGRPMDLALKSQRNARRR